MLDQSSEFKYQYKITQIGLLNNWKENITKIFFNQPLVTYMTIDQQEKFQGSEWIENDLKL